MVQNIYLKLPRVQATFKFTRRLITTNLSIMCGYFILHTLRAVFQDTD